VWSTVTGWGTKPITGLTTGITYGFKVKARNSDGLESAFGATASGTTVTTPAVSTLPATGATTTSVTANGTITNTYSLSVTSRGFIWYDYTDSDKTIGQSGVVNVTQEGTFDVGTFSATISALTVCKHYNVRAFATNENGYGYGARISVWTLPGVPSAPSVTSPTSSTLLVTINENDNPPAAEYAIQETSTGNYVQANGTLGNTAFWQTAIVWGTKTVTTLSPNTQYTFQVKARNGNNEETGFSETASFGKSTQ